MRLLICSFEYPPYGSGIGNAVWHLAGELRKKGVSVHVCSPTGPDIAIDGWKAIERWRGLGLFYFWHRVACALGHRQEYDLLWFHNPLFLWRVPEGKILATVHTTYAGLYATYRALGRPRGRIAYYNFLSLLEKRSMQRLRQKAEFTSASSQVAAELRSIGIAQHIACIANGVDIESLRRANRTPNLRRNYGIPEDALVFLNVGTLDERKRPDRVLRLVSSLRLSRPVWLLVVGDGPLRPRLETLAHTAGSHVRFFGRVSYEQLLELYSVSDLFVMASIYEGQPLALLEAMAAGLPPVVSKTPILREAVEHSSSGLVLDFEAGDAPVQLANYLAQRDLDQERWKARCHAEFHLNWRTITDQYLKVISTLVAEKEEALL